MLFGELFGRREKPRTWQYTPRYYDPELDDDRRERMRFDRYSSRLQKHRRGGRGRGTINLMLLALIIAGLILMLQYGFGDGPVKDANFDVNDVPVMTDDQESSSP